jgi:cellulose biosynthesis protein BcsQ
VKNSLPPDKIPRSFTSDEAVDRRVSDPFGSSTSLFDTEEEPIVISGPPPPPPSDTIARGALTERLTASLDAPKRTPPQQFPDPKQLLDARREAAQQAQLRATLKHHRIIAVVSESGGSGKTTVSLSLAHALALARPDSPLAIFEADPLHSTIARRLARPSPASLRPLLNASKLMTERTDFLPYVENLSSGLQIVIAPDHPALDDALLGPEYLELIDSLAKYYEIVIIDAPTGFTSPAALTALQSADQLIICSRATSVDLQAAKTSLDWIASQGGRTLAQTTILAITETSSGMIARLPKADLVPSPVFFATCLIPYDERLADSQLTTRRLRETTANAYQYLALATTYAFPVDEDEDLTINPGWKTTHADDRQWIH